MATTSIDAFRRAARVLRRLAGVSAALVGLASAGVAAKEPAADPAAALRRHQRIVEGLPRSDRQQLEFLAPLSPSRLEALAGRFSPEAIGALAREIEALGPPSPGSRPRGADGRPVIHGWLEARLRSMEGAGVRLLPSFRGEVVTPVMLERASGPRGGERSGVEIGGEWVPLNPLWPNGPMPSITPAAGIRGRLVDARSGDWADLDGLDLDGAIAVVGFSAGRRVETLFSLGVAAVIVREDGDVSTTAAEGMYSATPVPAPRFHVAPRHEAALLEAARRGDTVLLRGGAVLEPRPVETLVAHLPPGPPQEWLVRADSLWRLLAEQAGVSVGELQRANPGVSRDAPPAAGTSLVLPGGRSRVEVRLDETWRQLAVLTGTSVEELRAANPGAPDAPEPGRSLVIPNRRETVVVVAPIDSLSVVPDAPHGAKVATNLATALLMLEHAAANPEGRRKGLLVVFTDGDTHGGFASRLVAERMAVIAGSYRPSPEAGVPLDEIAAIRKVLAGGDPAIDREVVRRFFEDWVVPTAEARRIALAEQRVAALGTDRLAALEAELAALVAFRAEVLNPRGLEPAVRFTLWREAQADATLGTVLERAGVTFAALDRRLAAAEQEEVRRRELDQGNRDAAAALLAVIQGDDGQAAANQFGFYLDLGDGSRSLHFATGGPGLDLRRPFGRVAVMRQLSTRARNVLSFAALRAGWDAEVPFHGEEESRSDPRAAVRMPGAYEEFWRSARVQLHVLAGAGDRQPRLDTPHDVVARTDLDTVALLARHAAVLLGAGLANPTDSPVDRTVPKLVLGRVTGRVLEFNLRAGLDARDPVGGAVVFTPGVKETGTQYTNAGGARGFRRHGIVMSGGSGWFRLPVEDADHVPSVGVRAYDLDRTSGLFSKVATEGVVGSKPQEKRIVLGRGSDTLRNVVLTRMVPLVLYPGVEPTTYGNFAGNQYSALKLKLLDAVTRGTPRDHAVDSPLADFRESGTEALVVYGKEGSRLMVLAQQGVVFRLMLLGELDAKGHGRGYRLGSVESGGEGPRLALTPLRVARDMTALGTWREDVYRAFGITSRTVGSGLGTARARLAEAEAAVGSHHWQEAVGSSRESWGVMVRTYPKVLTLGRQALFSAVLLMALLVPASWFLERLAVRARGVVGQIAWTTGIFVAGTLALNALHPAFQIALSPFIVVIAFTMILMSIIVLGICYQRFESLLKRMRTDEGEVRSDGVGLAESLATALNLGLSNLRKYPLRTVLTTITVAALSFSVIAFVAVSGDNVAVSNPQELDRVVGEAEVEPEPPAHRGVLFRAYSWQELTESAVRALRAEFGHRFDVAARGFYLQQEGGNNAAREGVNQVRVTAGTRSATLYAVMTMDANEPRVSGIDRAVTGRWFDAPDASDPGSQREIVIPSTAAAALGIAAGDVIDGEGALRPRDQRPRVRMMGETWTVRGILDVEAADRLRDFNGKSLAIVDHLRSAMSDSNVGQIEQEGSSYHLSWSRLGIVPLEAGPAIGAKLRSVAVRVDDPGELEGLVDSLTLRRKDPFFVHDGNSLALVAPRERVDLGGFAKILLPVALCLVIVMNTMLGNVEERRGEIEMLGAIGLSPRQISFLFLAESSVYAVVGVVAGMMSGLLFANVASSLNAAGIPFFPDLSVNFTSLASAALAGLSGGIVLLASYLPASRASALAAPSGMAQWRLPDTGDDGRILFHLPFSLTGANAVGMLAFLEAHLARHQSADAEGFSCRGLDVRRVAFGEGRSAAAIQSRVWLAPYDLDVAQIVTFVFWPTEAHGVFRVSLALSRLSGSEDAWRRTNFGFLNDARRQFLVWRNLPAGAKAKFVALGRERFRDLASLAPGDDREAAALVADLAASAPSAVPASPLATSP